MLRKLLGAGVLLATLAGCTKLEGRTCTSDADCGDNGTCDTSVGLCYAPNTEPELDGGTCSPACAAYEACTSSGCKPRFTALNILSPTNNAALDGGTVTVSAQLVVNPTYASTTQLPETLVFSASRSGGGDVGSFVAVPHTGDTYAASWTPPASTQAPITLTVSHPTPGAVQNASVNVQLDSAPPTFTITFSSPPGRSSGSATQADERDPTPGYDVAFRRDEPVIVSISADEPVSNVTLTVVGIGPGGNPGQAQAPVTVQPGGSCNGNPVFCGNVTLDLSTLDMKDVRGSADFQVTGVDAVGNRGSASAGLKVTRWKWAFDAAGNIAGSPAVGARGVVYFGTNITNGTGKMFALKPDGTSPWPAPIAIGDTSGSPAVGAFNTDEYVYIAARSGSGPFLYALRGSDGTEKFKCSVTNVTDVPGSLAVGTTPITVGTAETGAGVFVGSQVHLVGIRPDALLSGDKCIDISGSGPSALPVSVPGGSFVMKDQNIFYGTTGSKLTSYDLGSGSNSPRSGWPQGTNSFPRGLALLADQVYGAVGNSDDPSLGSLFSVPMAGGTAISFVYPQASTSRVFNLAIGSSNTAYFGAETATTAELVSIALGTTGATPTKVSDVGVLRGAPIVGKNDRLYTLNNVGKVSAWVASTLAPVWSADLALDLTTKDTSPTLDCRRDTSGTSVAGSSSGYLYFAAGSKLYALIVDSPGMDPSAPWAKFQHDARNTGNPASSVTNCQ